MIRDFLAEMLPWLLSAITIWMTLATGQRKASGWLIGLLGQALWFVWVWASQKWGFLPLTGTLTGLYLYNWLKWREEEFHRAAAREAAAMRMAQWGKLP